MNMDVFKNVVAPRNQVLWLILAFQSGFMNAGGYLAVHRFVSHITGYGTYVGVALAQKQYLGAFEMALGPLFFLAGAIVAGWLVDRRMILGKSPNIEGGIITLAVLNLIIYLGEFSEYLGTFGEPLVLQRDFLLLFILCFACGLQNGLFSGATKGQVRTTHLTGPITDIGINISKIFTLQHGAPERGQLTAMNWLRVKIIVAFSSGSLIAALVFTELTYEGFAVPCAISLFLVWYVRRLVKSHEREENSMADQTASLLVPTEPVSVQNGAEDPANARAKTVKTGHQ
ncbi:YoaK family protein [Singulisphaera acidiphila]|uniref:Putative membrane protein n=2 Tax=Singulisphaera acidiphila TaxID=466153 RepID=L0D8J5_SINAD|nr:YoaK family protein [Singulisphaera acidiphila]AGA25190.1 putative membrane protein [Singulisphaera acidiphila DSM 18658]